MAAPSPYWRAQEPNAGNVKPRPGSGARPKVSTGQPSKRRRIVRTEAGARRYKVPIGAEIGTGRNAASARWQKHAPSTARYKALVGRDSKTQAKAFQGLNRTQLTRLTAVAYSFDSEDPNVARLRSGLGAELKRRGIDLNTYLRKVGVREGGSIGDPFAPKKIAVSKPPAPPRPKAAPKRRPLPRPKKKRTVPVVSARSNSAAARRKMIALSNVTELRRAVSVFSRVSPENRQKVARLLVQRAIELSATSLIGRSVIEAANIERESALGQQVIELAGKWKHGWIPVDATAMRIKMKGGNGKPWWSGGKQARRGSDTMRKAVEGGRAARAGKSTTSGSQPRSGRVRSSGNAWEDKYGKNPVRSSGNAWEDKFGKGRTSGAEYHADGPLKDRPTNESLQKRLSSVRAARASQDSTARRKGLAANKAADAAWPGNLSDSALKDQEQTWAKAVRDGTATKGEKNLLKRLHAERERRGLKPKGAGELNEAQKRYQARVGDGRTTVVKSGSTPTRGANMDLTGQTESELNIKKRALEGLAARKQPTKEQQREYSAIKAELARRKAGTASAGTGGRTTGLTESEKLVKERADQSKPSGGLTSAQVEELGRLQKKLERNGGNRKRLTPRERSLLSTLERMAKQGKA